MSMNNNTDKETTIRNAYRLSPSEKKGKWILKEIIVEQAVAVAIEGVGDSTYPYPSSENPRGRRSDCR
jgi:hypothetical protein